MVINHLLNRMIFQVMYGLCKVGPLPVVELWDSIMVDRPPKDRATWDPFHMVIFVGLKMGCDPNYLLLLMAEILHHLGCTKPYK